MFRDFLGWYFWLFGMPLLLILAVKGLGRFKPALKNLLMVDKQCQGNWFKKALNWIIAPNKLYGIHTIEQLEQRYQQIHQIMSKNPTVSQQDLKNLKATFLEAAKWRGNIQIFSFLTNLIILGVGVIGLNIAMTNKNVKKKVASGELDNNEPLLENRRRQKAHERNYQQPDEHLGLIGRRMPIPSAPAFATSTLFSQPVNAPTMTSGPAAWPMPPQAFAPYSSY